MTTKTGWQVVYWKEVCRLMEHTTLEPLTQAKEEGQALEIQGELMRCDHLKDGADVPYALMVYILRDAVPSSEVGWVPVTYVSRDQGVTRTAGGRSAGEGRPMQSHIVQVQVPRGQPLYDALECLRPGMTIRLSRDPDGRPICFIPHDD